MLVQLDQAKNVQLNKVYEWNEKMFVLTKDYETGKKTLLTEQVLFLPTNWGSILSKKTMRIPTFLKMSPNFQVVLLSKSSE